MASGIVAALVAITPAAGFVGSMHFVFGALAGAICFFAIEAKFRFGFDDSLDVVGIHFVGGAVGGYCLGLWLMHQQYLAANSKTRYFRWRNIAVEPGSFYCGSHSVLVCSYLHHRETDG